jgi:peptidoglycan DL-endopeptidase CwlO
MSPRIPSRSRLRRRTAVVALSSGLALGVGAATITGATVAAAPAAPAATVIGLQKGMSGENVKALQNALNRVGIGVKYGVDGYFGSATQASVKAFQRYKGLSITGVIDAATAKALGFAVSTPAAPAATATTVPKAAPAGTATSIAGLQGGASGPAVVQLQQAITRAGWPLAADGVFGTRTQAALISIQRANGIPATGTVDDRTARLLGLTGGSPATPITAALTAAAPAPRTPAPAVAAPTGPPPPVSAGAATAVAAATSQLGVPYVAFALEPGVAFDCSGLTAWAWKQAGVTLWHQSGMQYAQLPHVAVADAQPGDLLFYHSPIRHVSIYIGNGKMIHAPSAGSVVQIGTVIWSNVVGIGRPG